MMTSAILLARASSAVYGKLDRLGVANQMSSLPNSRSFNLRSGVFFGMGEGKKACFPGLW